jgi:hypothetical protein
MKNHAVIVLLFLMFFPSFACGQETEGFYGRAGIGAAIVRNFSAAILFSF